MTGGGGAWRGGRTFDSRRFAPADKDGWHRVRSNEERKGGRGHRFVVIAKGNRKHEGGEVTSLYFSSFPENWRAKDLLQVFDTQGIVQEIVIPARRNAQGKKFGFARFFDVAEPERLAIKLDNIFIEGVKIHVNLPRFKREKVIVRNNQARVPQRPISSKHAWLKKVDVIFHLRRTLLRLLGLKTGFVIFMWNLGYH